MKTYFFFVLIIFGSLFIGCSVRTTVMMEEYEGQKLSGNDLAIIKVFDAPSITNYDDVTDDLGAGVPEEVYMNFFKENFIKSFHLYSPLNEIKFIDNFPKSNLVEKTLDISEKDKMRAYLPDENKKIDSLNTDFILFLYNLSSNRIAAQSGTFVNGMQQGGSFGKLYHQISFVLWDNEKNKLVSYGRVDEESTIVFGMTNGHWESVLDGIALKILRLSPFQIKYSTTRQFK